MMVDTQVRPSDVTKFPIIEALLTVAKEDFVPDRMRDTAYVGGDVAIGEGRVILEPRNFAKMLDAADIQPDEVVLDIGCGLGYSTAVLARLAAFVVATESLDGMAQEAQAALSSRGIDNAAVLDVPLADGAPESGPYDLVIIEGGIETLPVALADQVKDGGRIVALFCDKGNGEVRVGHKIGGVLNWRLAFNAHAPVLSGFEKTEAFAF